jgi:hypothetical protein
MAGKTTGITDRSAVIHQLKHVQPSGPVAPAAKVEEVSTHVPENRFGDRSKHLDPKTGEGKPVSTTASASALWAEAGLQKAKPPLPAQTLRNLTPEQAKAKLTELEGKKKELGSRIDSRVAHLDERWKYTLLTTRTEALKDLSNSASLPPEKEVELQDALEGSQKAKSKIDDLRTQVKALEPQPGSKRPGTPEKRNDLAQKIMAARREHAAAVKRATQTVDDAGLKLERLAVAESKIDPHTGPGKYESLNALLSDYFHTNFLLDSMWLLYSGPLGSFVKEMEREAADSVKKHIVEEHWRERDDQMRDMLKRLQTKDVDTKQRLNARLMQAIGSQDVSKMPVSEVAKVKPPAGAD